MRVKSAKAVFWDIDGVLVENKELQADTIMNVAAEHGASITMKEYMDKLYGRSYNEIWGWLKDKRELSLSLKNFLKECADYYTGHVDQARTRPGVMNAFNHVAAKGLPQAAVSGGILPQVNANLDLVGVRRRMLFMLSAEEIPEGKGKPDSMPYDMAFERLASKICSSIAKEDCVVIEDSPVGIESGKKAGMTTVFWRLSKDVKSDYADYTVDTPEEFLAVVEKLTTPVFNDRKTVPIKTIAIEPR